MPAAGILDWKRSKSEIPILHNSKSPKNLRRIILECIKNIGRRIYQGGPTRQSQAREAHPTPLGAPLWLVAHLAGLRSPSSAIWRVLTWKKSEEVFQDEVPPPRGGTWAGALLPSGGAIPPGELPSRRGKSKPSSSPTPLSSLGGQSSSTYSTTPSPLKP